MTVYYDTEMTQLNVVGGGLPAGVLIRESPTKASLGRTTSSATGGGGYQTDSFFDIFTEVSTDSGTSWLPTLAGPAEVMIVPAAVSLCPATITSIAPGGGGYTIAYINGCGSQFVLLKAQRITAPMSTWTPVATNLTGAGTFSVSPTTNTFYRIQSR
jgi:hypothetical protein